MLWISWVKKNVYTIYAQGDQMIIHMIVKSNYHNNNSLKDFLFHRSLKQCTKKASLWKYWYTDEIAIL